MNNIAKITPLQASTMSTIDEYLVRNLFALTPRQRRAFPALVARGLAFGNRQEQIGLTNDGRAALGAIMLARSSKEA